MTPDDGLKVYSWLVINTPDCTSKELFADIWGCKATLSLQKKREQVSHRIQKQSYKVYLSKWLECALTFGLKKHHWLGVDTHKNLSVK